MYMFHSPISFVIENKCKDTLAMETKGLENNSDLGSSFTIDLDWLTKEIICSI